MSSDLLNAMSVDVEDYFQVQAFFGQIDRKDWDGIEARVERNTEKVMALFDRAGVKGTFFTLGWVAERYPALIRRIVENGHELASHGMAHYRADEQEPEVFREDIRRAKALLEDAGGAEVKGYRAATFSIGKKNMWAFDILGEEGYQYSSSINPVKHDLYGMPDSPRFAYRPRGENGILEIPVTTVVRKGQNIPCGGGGYFRLFPYMLFRHNLRTMQKADNQSANFYFHPWEVDPDQPKVPGISLKTRVRHYLNLGRMERRLERLMKDFRWGRMDEVYADLLEKRPAPSAEPLQEAVPSR
ncbi:polysaccharide deacetylase family protein (PEP-CTERM system associated) [Aestuariispira insulae]|uniref:Chitooligosaccharide deacetylase n=2 Tax=Aestuariispira insulae TaxID=1461337 RepID=A0A3D9HK73_9PROT|nr:polysaccharide deacetylase family protein (PEP-CTERM system associated) [Aestuariispira insulae]